MKDKDARESIERLESLSLVIRDCSICSHITIQQRGGLHYTSEGSYFEPDPYGASLNFIKGDVKWVEAYRCLVCGKIIEPKG